VNVTFENLGRCWLAGAIRQTLFNSLFGGTYHDSSKRGLEGETAETQHLADLQLPTRSGTCYDDGLLLLDTHIATGILADGF